MGRTALFGTLIAAGFFALAELALTFGGVTPLSESRDPFVGFDAQNPVFVPDGTSGFVHTAPNKQRFFNAQRFAIRKPAHTYRIFCLGGSTTYGRPYNDATSFCGWLRALLPAVDPTHDWEVINAGGISYASYRLTTVANDLKSFQPDLFLVYTGHNEFLERRTYQSIRDKPRWVREADAALSRTRVYSGLKRLLDPFLVEKRPRLPGEVDAVLDTVGPGAYRRDDAGKTQVQAHFEANLHRLVDTARAAGADSLFITPVANLKDCAPFKSQHRDGLSDRELSAWRHAMDVGIRAQRNARWSAAETAFREALAIDERYAEAHYRIGRAFLAVGRVEDARAALVRAVNEDVCPLRAYPEMANLVRRVATARGASLADFATRLAAETASHTGHTIPGEEFFLDHVHPTIRGHRLIALTVIDELVRMRVVNPQPDWGETRIAEVTEQIENRVDRTQHGIALRNLAKVLSWAGKTEDAARVAGRAVTLLGDDAESRFVLGSLALEHEAWPTAVDHYQRAVELEPDYAKAYNNLGIALVKLERYGEAVSAYRRALNLMPDHANAHYNLGNAYRKSGDLGAAITHYRLALARRPDDHDARYNLAGVLHDVGDLLAARGEYRRLLEAVPSDIEASRRLAALDAALEALPGADPLPPGAPVVSQ